MSQKDYYQILGIDNEANQQQIKDMYRRLALQYHPDRNRDNPAVAERMKEINEAYAVLSEPHKRREYDALRQQYGSFAYDQFRQGYSEQDIFRGSDINTIFEDIARASGLSGFDEIFKQFYGQEYRSFAFQRPGVFAKGFVYFSPFGRRYNYDPGHRNAHGGVTQPNFPLGGNLGKIARFVLKKMVGIEWPEKGKDWQDIIYVDPRQAEGGSDVRYISRRRSKDLRVKIPPGVKDGQRIRLRGMGASGKGGAEPGDLYLEVRVKKSILHKLRDLLGYTHVSAH
jgi:DnaJ-class molecular chaperone